MQNSPIGVFDSGYGGLSVLKEIIKVLPQYDYIYLGDNARTPYGNRSYSTIYEYTLQAVNKLFSMNCKLVILACNTASAKALRTIQQNDLPHLAPKNRVLGVIRPCVEILNEKTVTGHIGILGTTGTVVSNSYPLEIQKLFPHLTTFQEACPMWVPLVENDEYDSDGADYFVRKNIANLLSKSSDIDTIILACTHYPLMLEKIQRFVPNNINIITQGEIVAKSLENYLFRHPEMEKKCSKNKNITFLTTDSTENFNLQGAKFLKYYTKIEAIKIDLVN